MCLSLWQGVEASFPVCRASLLIDFFFFIFFFFQIFLLRFSNKLTYIGILQYEKNKDLQRYVNKSPEPSPAHPPTHFRSGTNNTNPHIHTHTHTHREGQMYIPIHTLVMFWIQLKEHSLRNPFELELVPEGFKSALTTSFNRFFPLPLPGTKTY